MFRLELNFDSKLSSFLGILQSANSKNIILTVAEGRWWIHLL